MHCDSINILISSFVMIFSSYIAVSTSSVFGNIVLITLFSNLSKKSIYSLQFFIVSWNLILKLKKFEAYGL